MSRTMKQPYRGARAMTRSCRNHGSCPWCRGNRQHKNKRREPVRET